MKTGYKLLFLPLFILALAGCKEDPTAPTFDMEKGYSITLPYDIRNGETLTFSASDSWTINKPDSRLSISRTSGGSGTNNIVIKANDYNCTNDDVDYTFSITSSNEAGTKSVDVTVTHEPVFRVETLNYEADAMGDTLHIIVTTKADVYSSVNLYYDINSDFAEMIGMGKAKAQSQTVESKAMCVKPLTRAKVKTEEEEHEFEIVIDPNLGSSVRTGYFRLGIGEDSRMLSEEMAVVQPPANIYHSKDMETEDGKVTQLQKHTVGNGVPVVILGDGFVDRDIANGKFREAANRAVDALFSLHPMKTLRNCFDVYEVTAVSYDGYFSNYTTTAFGSKFTSASSTEIQGDDDRVAEYASKAIGEGRINDAVVIVLINDGRYAGTCSMYTDRKQSDVPNGMSIAYVPLIESTEPGTEFPVVLCHEAVGHGFAKLADEYCSEENGKMSDADKRHFQEWQEFGFSRNIALDSDVTKSYWANFASDSRYAFERLGCYEGAAGYVKDVYRPTFNSIMNDNIDGFNVAGRVMIYKRCMKIALGDKWKFSNADFVAFDLEEAKASASSKRRAPAKRSSAFKPLGKPRIIVKVE